MRESVDIEQAMALFGDTVWRVCSLHFSNKADAEDAFQETFLKYSLADEKEFADSEHAKAWLIRVAQNQCRDMLRAEKRRTVPFPDEAEAEQVPAPRNDDTPSATKIDIVDAMRRMDDPPRTPLYLSIYEGYSAPEIAEMTGSPVNTVYSWISRGRKILKEALE